MRNNIKNFIKGVLGIYNTDLSAVGGHLETSAEMDRALCEWLWAFYNKPAWNQNKKVKQTNFAGVVSGYAATLAASEITLSAGDGTRADYINRQLERFVLPGIRVAVQKACAGGYVVAKPHIAGPNIYTDFVTPDAFYPTRIAGGVFEAGFFVDSAKVNGKTYLRLEFHNLQPDGVHIRNEVYRDTAVRKNMQVPLTSVPEWAMLQPEVIIKGVSQPLYAVLKMPFANQVDPASKLPVSLYANAMESLKDIDSLYTGFHWEVSTGKRRQILDVTALSPRNARDNAPAKYELSDQYMVLNMDGAVKPYDDYTPAMRVEEYQRALNIQLRLLESQCQLSAETFTFDVQSGKAQTATEIISKDSDTFNTIQAIREHGLKQGLADLIRVYNVYASLYRLAPEGNIEPCVTFGDSIFEDTGVEYQRLKALVDSNYLKPEILLAKYFGITENAAKEMMPRQEDLSGITLGGE